MSVHLHETTTAKSITLPGWLRAAPYLAITASIGYLVLGVLWALGAGGNPFAESVYVGSSVGILGGLSATASGWVIAAICAIGLVVGAWMNLARRTGSAQQRSTLLIPTMIAALLAIVLAVVLPDYRMIATIGYAPVLAVNAIAGNPLGVNAGQMLSWPVLNLIVLTLAGICWAITALRYYRAASHSCQRCGRSDRPAFAPAARACVGRWSVGIAVAIPIGYAATRFAWALGIPLGVSKDLLDDLGSFAYVGAGLGAFAVLGAVLTLGLIRGWGEVFPRWIPILRGRTVPIGLAVVPALLVSVIVTSAGVMFVRFAATGEFGNKFPGSSGDVAAWLPEMFWPIWGVALAVAAVAYWLRRRGGCATCGRG